MHIAKFDATAPPPPPADWEQVRPRTLEYLRNGEVVTIALDSAEDELDPGSSDVPIGFRTDGQWIWSMELEYYARKHALPIDPDLMAHIRAMSFAVPSVSSDSANQAWDLLLRMAELYGQES